MIPRCFILLGVFALFGVIAVLGAEEVDEKSDNNARLIGPAAIVRKLFRSLFIGVAASCLKEAVDKCKSDWKNPENALQCARDFLNNNQGRCHVGSRNV